MGLQFLEYDSKNNHIQLLESIHELNQLVDEQRQEIAKSLNW